MHVIRDALILLLALPLVIGCAITGSAPGSDSGALSPSPGSLAPGMQASPGATSSPSGLQSPSKVRIEIVARNLEVPWALAFAPDGRLFFTERPGRIRVIVNGQLVPEPVATLPVATAAEAGLLGLALDPDFALNRLLYVMYTYRDGRGQLKNRVARLTERGGKAAEELGIVDNLPGSDIHDGGRLKFGPDGKLYVTTGDAASPGLAQSRDSLAGKILRLNSDGSIPPDNPVPGSPIYSLGHRNPQGLAWHPATGILYSTEHGPIGSDEVNIIEPGQNYGWPEKQGPAQDPRYKDPILTFSPSVAPSGASFYQGQALAGWAGNLFFTTLVGEHLHWVVLKAPEYRQVERHEVLFEGQFGRLRDVALGPEGFLYLATSNRDGRGRPRTEDDRILRIVPGG